MLPLFTQTIQKVILMNSRKYQSDEKSSTISSQFIAPRRIVILKIESTPSNPNLGQIKFLDKSLTYAHQHLITSINRMRMKDIGLGQRAGKRIIADSRIPSVNVLEILDKAGKDAGSKERTVGSPDRGLGNILPKVPLKPGLPPKPIKQKMQGKPTTNILPRDIYQSIGQSLPLLIIGLYLWWEYVPEQAREQLLQHYHECEQQMREFNSQMPPGTSDQIFIYKDAENEVPERDQNSMAVWIEGITLGFGLLIATARIIKGE